jgi:hypothetical protein
MLHVDVADATYAAGEIQPMLHVLHLRSADAASV